MEKSQFLVRSSGDVPNLLLEPLLERRTTDHCSFHKLFSESLRSGPVGPSGTADLVDT